MNLTNFKQTNRIMAIFRAHVWMFGIARRAKPILMDDLPIDSLNKRKFVTMKISRKTRSAKARWILVVMK